MSIQFKKLGQSANVNVTKLDDEDVVLTFSSFPTTASMALPMTIALQLADEIIAIARKQLKEAA
jgi:hypothetical protein